jgi:pimeloyl-ACP methyl ester carboxylesterase
MDDQQQTAPAAAAPAWFTRAIAAPYESRTVEVAGCPIHYLRWGDAQKPGLVLVPGSGGHAHWFSHVAPLFADQFNVVAIDLGGNGDSGRRSAYTIELVIEEIMAVCADAGMMGAWAPPTLVGHSMGGQFAVRTAIARGEALLGVVALDALRHTELAKDPAIEAFKRMRPTSGPPPAPRAVRAYPDRASAAARFRLQPEPELPITTPYVLEHIGWNSVRETPEGWSWKYDTAFGGVSTLGLELKDALKGLACRSAAVYGENTHIVGETLLSDMAAATGGEVPVFIIPGSCHYPMIDSPLAFVSAVKGVVLTWLAEVKRAGR